MGQGYYYACRPKDVESRYELLVFNSNNEPFLPLTDFYQDNIGRISKSSVLSYLQCLLPFFNWLEQHSRYQGRHVKWDNSPEVIRIVIEDYLKSEMECRVREKDSFCFVNLTNKSPNTVNRFLSAIKSFYKSLIRLKQYNYPNPLIDSQAILNNYRRHLEGVRKDKPRMPAVGGTEEPLEHRRLTDSYFKILNEEWQPKIIDDPHLPFQVYQAGKNINWSQRETVISRMLFETGARASEIIELTIGDYRSRKSHQEVITFSKGSYGRKIKFLRFSKDTVKRLFQYMNTERMKYDLDHFNYEQLPDEAPIFLSEFGTPLTYYAWYYHWNKAMINGDIRLNPHKARHWFVTTRLREIHNISKNDSEIQQRKNELIKYMKWKNPDILRVYEHYFDEEKHRDSHDQMLENMQKNELEYKQSKKMKKKNEAHFTIIEAQKEIDHDLQELLEGLE
ncbi:tyrosine-type recombinase/integrase [Bacillus thuringiensis]|uniref:tyrosine-type recombinase/integrase n=1 Tax=Bacillus thuringiensis TaxID=1428 RepID=UPI000BF93C83|nr:site-specific integrase [Bacillus thuringiensis]PES48677.1 integrase [Bacillus thuringiensis]